MEYVRIIPCLDVHAGRVVKGVKFIDLQDVGDPAELAAAYEQTGADELVFLDISATVEERKTTLEAVRRTGDMISIPLIVGGGISSLQDMQELFAAGADKISINTKAVEQPSLIEEASRQYGNKRIIVAIDACRRGTNRWEVVIRSGRTFTGLEAKKWAQEVEQRGAGEILLTSMDRDGTAEGFDLELTRLVSEAVDIPVIASGGAGTLEHLWEAVAEGKAGAVLAASLFHFGSFTIVQAKEYLRKKGVSVR